MDGSMDQNVTGLNSANQVVGPGRREPDQWFDSRRIDMTQHQQMQPSYYKFQNEMVPGNFPEMPTAAQWWRVDTGMSVTPQLSRQDEGPSGGYQLIGHPMDPLPSTELQLPEVTTKKPSKPRVPKKTRPIKETKEIIKRTKHPEKWKVNVKKNARLRGEEYVGVGGKIVPAKIMGPPCDCRMRCSDKIDEEAREQLHNVFWKTCTWEQRKQYIALSVKESPKQRSRCRGNVKSEHRRQVTFTYSLLIKSEFITVCKPMFLSTFSVSEKFVRHAMDKKRTSPGGIIGPDQRGRHTPKTKKSEEVKERVRDHINSFPAEKINPKDRSSRRYLDSSLSIAAMHKLYVQKCKEDGIPDSDTVKESYYREMFKSEFNLGFKMAVDKEKEVKKPTVSSLSDNKHKL
ncbi:uncharacterized protein LOC105693669 isoform X1 [Athalia rosae]|uniref:uncharacterized protein LOC105693669 isoform X1 n=1 Tax=Athalia rosae TaxID=37344 RepID=UPI0006255367|nr:uncharacterized protein LOC105693669 isoform X1 [Athalia rosae]